MKKFCIIGVAGFVAKKHLKCIEIINGSTVVVQGHTYIYHCGWD